MPISHIKEHELKQSYGHEKWKAVLAKETKNCDVFLNYTCVESDKSIQDLQNFAKELDKSLNIVLFEECVEKGGGGDGGILPTIFDYIQSGTIFALGSTASGFFQKMGEDAYDKLSRMFSKYRLGLKAKGSLHIKLIEKNGKTHTYYYPEELSADEAIEAFRRMRTHYSEHSNHLTIKRFVFIPKINSWEIIS